MEPLEPRINFLATIDTTVVNSEGGKQRIWPSIDFTFCIG